MDSTTDALATDPTSSTPTTEPNYNFKSILTSHLDNDGKEVPYDLSKIDLEFINYYNEIYEYKVNKNTKYEKITDDKELNVERKKIDFTQDKYKSYFNNLTLPGDKSNSIGGAPNTKDVFELSNYIHDFYSEKIHKILNTKTHSFERYCKFLKNIIDFHTWYDKTSAVISYAPKSNPSIYLNGLELNKDKIDDPIKPFYGGLFLSMDNFYQQVMDTVQTILLNKNLTENNKKGMIMQMYCIGKNINYWLAKRYLYLCVGNEEINSDVSLSTVINRDEDKIIPKDIYNLLREDIINNFDIKEGLFALYQYDMLNGITDTADAADANKTISIVNYDNSNSLKHQQLMKLIFNKFKGTFLRNDLETKYEVNKTNMEYGKEKPITKFVKSMSDDKTIFNINDKSKYNNFFAKNTILQTALRTPRAFSGGKMFCGGAENLFNGANLYRSIYNNIKQKFQTLNVIMNEDDKKKIDSLIDRTAELETKLYNILANLNKFITSDLAEDKKHVEVNYDMIAAAVEQYEKTVKSYNKKNYVLFKDLMILLNYSRKITEHMTI